MGRNGSRIFLYSLTNAGGQIKDDDSAEDVKTVDLSQVRHVLARGPCVSRQ